ncbi:MAG: CAP domain-containing protein [Clostridia bacterium]|nr:CAP domain-containing protein [Clostridia bacterium]
MKFLRKTAALCLCILLAAFALAEGSVSVGQTSGGALEVSWSGAGCGSCELTIYRDGWPLCVRSAEGDSGTLYFDISANPGTYKARLKTDTGCVTSGEVTLSRTEEPVRTPEPTAQPESTEAPYLVEEPAYPQDPAVTPEQDTLEPAATEQPDGAGSPECDPGENAQHDCEPTPEANGNGEPVGTPTATPTPETSATVEPTVTSTAVPKPTATATAEPTVTPTAGPTPTATATAEPTVTPTAAPAPTATIRPTETPTPTARPVHTSAPTAIPSGEARDALAEEVISQVNAERAKQGLKPLSVSAELNRAAEVRAGEIAVSFSHTRPDGTAWSTVSDAAYGENIAMGQRTADKVMAAWMSSDGHRANILHASYGTIGLCAYVSGGVTYWVQLFGR